MLQWSILSPLLFILYRPGYTVTSLLNIIMFADDTNTLFTILTVFNYMKPLMYSYLIFHLGSESTN